MSYFIYAVIYVLIGLALMFSLAIFYWAGMHLKKLPFTGGFVGKIFVFVGKYLAGTINLALNTFYLSIVCLDPLHIGTCSSRLKGYNTNETGDSWLSNWRLSVCDFWEPFVNPYDPAGSHIGGEDKRGTL